ncbi:MULTISPECIES: hypothetical protein [Bacillus]|uniref:hypothetical protein n=1 Tax=Bacillus TaxID=1386 RepID=UPI000814C5D0|nr:MULTISPECIES: hypothetical protein [Bacillus]MBU8786503.1 hypothetical protein [Bacillus glycinifermentans]MDU0069791.1 hypothetical protein [Bacillus sp. IG6]MED8018077.1 hypothetical protein [Bacillus glycinifermentans]WKB79353.1 hypothetical protein QYM22_11090 [Bacillus glycinifermentans]SCA85947.1 hypothetical protein BGLY_2124 [Bacillus glycinifermentans]
MKKLTIFFTALTLSVIMTSSVSTHSHDKVAAGKNSEYSAAHNVNIASRAVFD